MMYRCPCCNNDVFKEQHCFEICPYCHWEDDPVQYDDPNYSGGANILSLNEFKKLFLKSIKIQDSELNK